MKNNKYVFLSMAILCTFSLKGLAYLSKEKREHSYLAFLPRELFDELARYFPFNPALEKSTLSNYVSWLKKYHSKALCDARQVGDIITHLARVFSRGCRGVYSNMILEVVKEIGTEAATSWWHAYILFNKEFVELLKAPGSTLVVEEIKNYISTGVVSPTMEILTSIDPFTGCPCKYPVLYSFLSIAVGRKDLSLVELLLKYSAPVSDRELWFAQNLACQQGEGSVSTKIYHMLLQSKEKQ